MPQKKREAFFEMLPMLIFVILFTGLLILLATLDPSQSAQGSTDIPPMLIPACPTEDSINCFWDASTHGNGKGFSFVNLNGIILRLGE